MARMLSGCAVPVVKTQSSATRTKAVRLFSVITMITLAAVSDLRLAQTAPPLPVQTRAEPYNMHHDKRFGHDHFLF